MSFQILPFNNSGRSQTPPPGLFQRSFFELYLLSLLEGKTGKDIKFRFDLVKPREGFLFSLISSLPNIWAEAEKIITKNKELRLGRGKTSPSVWDNAFGVSQKDLSWLSDKQLAQVLDNLV